MVCLLREGHQTKNKRKKAGNQTKNIRKKHTSSLVFHLRLVPPHEEEWLKSGLFATGRTPNKNKRKKHTSSLVFHLLLAFSSRANKEQGTRTVVCRKADEKTKDVRCLQEERNTYSAACGKAELKKDTYYCLQEQTKKTKNT